MYDLKLPCDADPDCLHPACHHCDRLLFHSKQRKKNHPGTTFGVWRDLLCNRCKLYGREPYQQHEPEPEPEPDPLARNESHVLISDQEMERIRIEYPTQYEWHMWRREHRLKLGEYS